MISINYETNNVNNKKKKLRSKLYFLIFTNNGTIIDKSTYSWYSRSLAKQSFILRKCSFSFSEIIIIIIIIIVITIIINVLFFRGIPNMIFRTELWIPKPEILMGRRKCAMDKTWLENTSSRSQVATREPSNTIPTSTVSTLMCITATEITILEAAKEDKQAVAMEGTRVATAAMAVTLSIMKMVTKATVLCLTGVLFLAFTGTSLSLFRVFSIHIY
jgi:uncharacterized membrane protein YkgB